MGRRKTAKQIEKDLAFAKAREAYVPPDKEEGATTRKNPLIAVAYKPVQIAAGDAAKKYKVQASRKKRPVFWTNRFKFN